MERSRFNDAAADPPFGYALAETSAMEISDFRNGSRVVRGNRESWNLGEAITAVCPVPLPGWTLLLMTVVVITTGGLLILRKTAGG